MEIQDKERSHHYTPSDRKQMLRSIRTRQLSMAQDRGDREILLQAVGGNGSLRDNAYFLALISGCLDPCVSPSSFHVTPEALAS